MTPELVVDGDRRMVVAGRSRLVFFWTGSRWVHSLEVQGYGEKLYKVLASSVEADSDRDLPTRVVSPSFQDIHFQTKDTTILALLVGQSGPHHFSAVFSVDCRGDLIRIGIDVADRCRVPVEYLASTYSVSGSLTQFRQGDRSAAFWETDQGNLSIVAKDPAQVSISEAGQGGTLAQTIAGPLKEPGTQRYSYTWQWSPHFLWIAPEARSFLEDLE